jgi:GH35 family endo-1,4-beta-xylanase
MGSSKNIILLLTLVIAQFAPAAGQINGCSAESCAQQNSSVPHSWRPATLPEPNPNSETLRAAAAKIGLYIGTMVDPTGDGFDSDATWFRNILSTEFNLMEPGNQLKWWIIEPTQSTYNFSPGDHLLEFASANGSTAR